MLNVSWLRLHSVACAGESLYSISMTTRETMYVVVQLGHAGEKKGEEEEHTEDFTRRDKHHFGLRDLEVMETLGGCFSLGAVVAV